MLTPLQTPPKLLFISPKYFMHHNIMETSQQVISHNKKHPIQIIVRSLERSNELDLKLALLIQPSCLDPKQQWAVCTSSEWKNGEIGKGYEGVCVILEEDGWVEQTATNVFGVRGLKESLSIIGMTKTELQKRWKMELLLRKSNLKYQSNKSIYFLRSIATRIMQLSIGKQTKLLRKYMEYHGHFRLNKLRTFFTQWLIWHYEAIIHKRQRQIIDGDYLVQNTNRRILQKCFAAWKLLMVQENPLNKN